ncbi:MAG: hypothetical protein HY369_00015 [Candidatus Aenigmarchaeota archaeon]|nr:hypothetical protein [Candidatus Aenigmarchaeota archaeon]
MAFEDAPAIISQLLDNLYVFDVVFYVFSVLFFGSIAVRGFRGVLGWLPHLGLRIVMGVVSILGGLAMSGFFPSLGQGVYLLFNADILVGSLITSVLLAIGLYLFSHHLINVKALEDRIAKLEKRKNQAKHLPPEKLTMRDPVKIAGLAVIVVVVAFSLIGFSGFPSISGRLFTSFGISQEELSDLSSTLETFTGADLPAGCASAITVLQPVNFDLNALPTSTNPTARATLEAGSGTAIPLMKQTTYQGAEYFLATTADGRLCHALTNQFCGCIPLTGP